MLSVSRNFLFLCTAINCAIKVVYGPIYFQYFLLDVCDLLLTGAKSKER
jgi:hypothetical protein